MASLKRIPEPVFEIRKDQEFPNWELQISANQPVILTKSLENSERNLTFDKLNLILWKQKS